LIFLLADMVFPEKIRQHERPAIGETTALDELVRLCLQDNRQAWEEFFRRYIPLIKKAITGTLKDQYDAEAIRDAVFEQIFMDLVKKRLLAECRDLHGLSQWLATVSENRTIDWLRAKKRLKRLPEKAYNEGAISLFKVLDAESGMTLLDILEAPQESDSDLTLEAEKALDTLGSLSNWEQQWLLRLSVASQCPLSPDEWQSLYAGSGCDQERFAEFHTALEKDLAAKEKKKRESATRTETLWHQIYRLETKLLECDENEREPLEKKIAQLRKIRGNHLHVVNRFIRPQYNLIAVILGIGEEKVKQISGLLARARKALAKRIEAAGY